MLVSCISIDFESLSFVFQFTFQPMVFIRIGDVILKIHINGYERGHYWKY
jgi:hypothetical protein